jgi:hypothetical protein
LNCVGHGTKVVMALTTVVVYDTGVLVDSQSPHVALEVTETGLLVVVVVVVQSAQLTELVVVALTGLVVVVVVVVVVVEVQSCHTDDELTAAAEVEATRPAAMMEAENFILMD